MNPLHFVFAAFALIACGEAKEEIEETVDDVRAAEACDDYCDKLADCADEEMTESEDDACEARCEDDLRDNCGEDDRPAAVEKINECVEMSCGEFAGCMVFEAAPACFGFVD